jgi:hypothetical protein
MGIGLIVGLVFLPLWLGISIYQRANAKRHTRKAQQGLEKGNWREAAEHQITTILD